MDHVDLEAENGNSLNVTKLSTRPREVELASSPGRPSPVKSQVGRRAKSLGAANDITFISRFKFPLEPNSTPSTPPKVQSRPNEDSQNLGRPPPLQRHAHSAPMIPNSHKSPQTSPSSKTQNFTSPRVDDLIARTIRGPILPSKKGDRDVGFNYVMDTVLKETSRIKLVKVGFTKGPVPKRQRDIQATCHRETTWEPKYSSAPTRHYKRAEKLIKAELSMSLHKFRCSGCDRTHTEYHAAPRRLVLEVTERWVSFCEAEPWDEGGYLHPFWEQRLRKLQVASRGRHTLRGEPVSISWRDLTDVGMWSVGWFNLCCVGQQLRDRGTAWVVLLLSLSIAVGAYPSRWVFGMFVVVALWLMLMFTCENVKLMRTPPRTHTRFGEANRRVQIRVPGALEEVSSLEEDSDEGYIEEGEMSDDYYVEEGEASDEDYVEEEEEEAPEDDAGTFERDETVGREVEANATPETVSRGQEGTRDTPIVISSSEDEG